MRERLHLQRSVQVELDPWRPYAESRVEIAIRLENYSL